MHHRIILSVLLLLTIISCRKIGNNTLNDADLLVEIVRYDRLQSRYLTTGDFSALQQMSTGYPMETRILIEDVLEIGQVNDADINSKLLNFFQDTIAQSIIAEAEAQYARMDDINQALSKAFQNLRELLPDATIPTFYTQISAFRQSIVVSNDAIGISIDKYLGADYPLYKRYYTEEQTRQMTRANILPDCLSFYLISQFPLDNFDNCSQRVRDNHITKIHWLVNKLMGKTFYKDKSIDAVNRYMQHRQNISFDEFLRDSVDSFLP